MANVSSNMIITDESLSQISREILGQEEVSVTFPKILVGDGKYPLVNASGPILNHVYEFPVMEVTRTNNNVLLTTTIDEDAHLTIKEIALYCEFQDGSTHIFSKISGLSVAKGANLAYNLIIQAKLDLNVVNTTAFPEIRVKEVEYPKYSDFDTVDKVYVYATENLERMIKTNALGIGSYNNGVMTEQKPVGVGYNKAQTYCQLQDKISRWEEGFCASFDYSNIKKKFSTSTITERKFDKSLLTLYGNAEVSDDGKGSVLFTSDITVENEALLANSVDMSVDVQREEFISNGDDFCVDESTETMLNSSINRIEPVTFNPIDFTRWDFTVGFTTGTEIYNKETVLNFSNDSLYQPLILGLREGSCYLKLGKLETLQTLLIENNQSIFFNRSMTSVLSDYYSWTTQSAPIGNLHGTVNGSLLVDGSVISNFSTTNYFSIKQFLPLTNSWSIEFDCTTGDTINGTLFAFGKKTANGVMGVKCTLNTNFVVELSTDGETITDILTGTSVPTANTTYSVKITFDGEHYKLFVDNVPEVTLVSAVPVYNSNDCVSYIGTDCNTTSVISPLNGAIDLANSIVNINNSLNWDGYYSSQTILLKDLIPLATSKIYDGEGYEMSSLLIDNYFSGEIINSNLFNLLPDTKYLVKAKFDGRKYTASYSIGGKFEEVLNVETSESIGTVKKIIIGAQYNAQIRSYISPYSDVLDLDDFDISFYKYNDNGTIAAKTNYNFTYTVTISEGKDLLDYFYFPEYHYSYYKIKNLGYDSLYSYIDAYEGYLKGRDDKIDFNNSKGFTLYVNTYIPKEDALIIAKGDNETETYYFTLEKEGNNLAFNYSLGESTATVKGALKSIYTTAKLPVSIFITINGEASPTVKMYVNNEMIANKQLSQHTSLEAKDYYITNVKEGNEYIKVLAGFDGILSNDEMYYINRVLDTNL